MSPIRSSWWWKAALVSCLFPLLSPWVAIRINTTHSHPAWLFLILKTRPARVGELAVLSWPTDAYWPQGAVMLKPIIAEGPRRIDIVGRTLWIDQAPWATAVPTGTHGQPLPVPSWHGVMPTGWVLLGTTHVWDSWDSRYYGPVPREWLGGTAIPIW